MVLQEIRATLKSLKTEIEGFLSYVLSQVETSKKQVESLNFGIMASLKKINAKIKAIQTEINSQIKAVETEIDSLS